MNNNEYSEKKLSGEINELGHLLGDVLKEQEDIIVFNTVEKLRALTKLLRAEPSKALIAKIKRIIDKLSLDEANKIVRAFSVYFILINAADEVHQLRRQRYHRLKTGKIQKGSLRELETEFKNFKSSDVQNLFNKIEITPVFTAHPTEATRQTVLRKIQNITGLLTKRDITQIDEKENLKIKELLKTEITLLWQTSEIRFKKVTIEDEVQRGLFFLKNLYNIVPLLREELDDLLNLDGQSDWSSPAMLKFGTWIGGDRDGHPFVTPDISRYSLTQMKNEIIDLYLNDLDYLYQYLSSSTSIINASEKLLFENEKQRLVNEDSAVAKEPSELYRKKLRLIHKKLLGTKNNQSSKYETAADFIEDLRRLERSLEKNKGKIIAENLIAPLIFKAETFGFYLAQMDIRQNAKIIEMAVSEIFSKTNLNKSFSKLDDKTKINLLTSEILNPRPLVNKNLELSSGTKKILAEVELVKWGKDNISNEATNDFIISNCSSVTDVLSLVLLAKESGLLKLKQGKIFDSMINILPLFETIYDLRNSADVMENLFNNEAYRKHLKCRSNVQKIMIGYSDSNKDGGIVTSNFELYNAQIRLKVLCEKYNIELVIFHGRGGSISRGGGPLNQSILAQPSGTIKGKIKLTEQGEMISSKYLVKEKALRSLELIISAVIKSTLLTENDKTHLVNKSYVKTFETISLFAFDKYRNLVTGKNFIEYFRTATPIDIIENLEIGSRPSSRKKNNDIKALRAIPWVFSWTQNRQTISGWYGFGSSIKKAVDEDITDWEQLKEMFNNWEFFKSMVLNLQMVLFKTDMIIGSEYSKLCSNSTTGREINKLIKNEYQLSKECLLNITGEKNLLDNNPTLQRSLMLRDPYIDPISFIQLRLIKEYRTSSKKQKMKILNVLRSSINGVAAGIRNTG